jgi:hypothetical protein
MGLTFGQLEDLLARYASVHPIQRRKLRARLQQWQKMKFPEGVNVGRGTKATYGATQIFQLVFLLSLLKVGLPPERAQEAVKFAWPTFRAGIIKATKNALKRVHDPVFCFLEIDGLHALKMGNNETYGAAVLTSEASLREAFMFHADAAKSESPEWRARQEKIRSIVGLSICIELDLIVHVVWMLLAQSGYDLSFVANEFRQWREENARIPEESWEEMDLVTDDLGRDYARADVTQLATAMLGGETDSWLQ